MIKTTNTTTKRFAKTIVLLFAVVSSSILSATNLYWIGGTGFWNDPTHWSSSTGGPGGIVIPTSSDNVFFDANSFIVPSQTVTINVAASCNNMDWTGVTFTPACDGGANLDVYGSLTMVAGMTWNFANTLTFKSTAPGKTITTAGNTIHNVSYFDGVGGSWTLQDAFTIVSTLYLVNGTLNTNNQTINCFIFDANNNNIRALNLGSSIVNLSAGTTDWVGTGNNFSLNAGTSTINITSGAGYFNGGLQSYNNVFFTNPVGNMGIYDGASYNKVVYSGTGFLAAATGAYFASVDFQGTGLSTINGNSANFGKIIFGGSADITSSNTFDSLIFSAGKTYNLTNAKTQTINNLFQVNGTCTQPVIIKSSTVGQATTVSSTAAVISVNYGSMQDIHAVGGATFAANNSTDMGNNTGWTINAPASQNFYWVFGAGNWNDPSHWSASSGGPAGMCIPSRYDNVFFDANSFTIGSKIVTVNVASECNNMDWTGATQSPVLTGTSDLNIFGSLTFISAMTNSFTGKLYFKSTLSGNTITSAGKSFASEMHFNGINGDWTLQDALTLTGTSGQLYIDNGFLVTNDKALTCYYLESSNANSRGMSLGASLVTITGADPSNRVWYTGGANFFIDGGTSLIKFTYVLNGGTIAFYGGAGNYFNDLLFQDATTTGNIQAGTGFHNVTFNGNGQIDGASGNYNMLTVAKNASLSGATNTFGKGVFLQNATLIGNNLTFDTLQFTGGYTYTLGAGITTNITNKANMNGSCSAPINIFSSGVGSFASINSPSNITGSYLTLRDIHATGSFVASNSVDLGNNTGWIINAPVAQNLYWRGGTGNWNDPTHWSFTSGGAGGACVPTRYDNVFFNGASFVGAPKQVTINVPAYCNSLNFTGVPSGGHSIQGSNDLNIYGSLTFVSTIVMTSYTGKVYFKSNTTGNTITSSGKTFPSDVYFDGVGGGWTLQDAFASGYLYLSNGNLNTNGKSLNILSFYSNTSTPKQLTLGSSIITITAGSAWSVAGTNLIVNAGTSLIKFTSPTGQLWLGANLNSYYDVLFQDPASSATITAVPANTFHNVTFNGSSAIMGGTYNKVIFNGASNNIQTNNNTFDSLIYNGVGSNNFFGSGFTQTINRYLKADGTAGNLLNFNSNSGAPFATIKMTSCTVCCNYLNVSNIHTTGGASFYADNSTNGGGNSGWNFASCPSTTLTVGPINGAANTCINSSGNVYSIPSLGSSATYAWTVPVGAIITSGQGTSSITVTLGSTGGNIAVTASACGNTNSASKAITVNSIPVISNISVVDATCNHHDGSATATVSSGTAPYIYQWSSGDTLALADSLTSGQYLLQVYDTYGCKVTATTNVNASNGPVVSLVSTTQASCNGGSDGALTVSVSGGTAPYTALWSNGSTALSLTGLVAGPYDLTLSDVNNCTVSKTITVTQVSPIVPNVTSTPSACAGATGGATASPTGGSGSYTYLWFDNMASFLSTSQSISSVAAGNYYLVINDIKCSASTNVVISNVASTLSTNVSNIVAGDCSITSAGSLTINASGGSGSYTYYWSNSDNTLNTTNATFTGLAPGTYYCTVTDASLCTSVQTAVVPSSIGTIQQSLCMVTVDTTTLTNLVIWEKTTTHDIKSFKIYRESSIQNVYTAIATVPYASLSQFTDSVANPAVHSWRYKITAVDSCNNETAYSLSHKTIHLSQNQGVGGEINLAWDYYDGFSYNTYYIWRHDPSTNWMKIDSLSANYTTYTDFTPPSVNARYMIEVIPPGACNTTFKLPNGNGTYVTVTKSRSNIRNNRTAANGIKTNEAAANLFVYPNPASSVITVMAESKVSDKAMLIMESMLGERIITQAWDKNTPRQTIDVGQLSKGVYLLRLVSEKGSSVKKIIIE